MRKRNMMGMTLEQRLNYLDIREVREFYDRIRLRGGEKREFVGVKLTIPQTVLEVIRENLDSFSKLAK